jgi:hypothetical protein
MDCPKPENPLARRLDQLDPCWLELAGCCQIVYLPLPLMAARHGGALVLRDVLPRLRCSKCGRRPPMPIMALVHRPEPKAQSWHIPLNQPDA